MKKQLLIKTSLLLVALLGGASASWAEGNRINIPQDMGDHIVLGDNSSNFASYVTTHEGCTLDPRLKKSDTEYVTVGTSKDGATLTLNVTATRAGDYVFGFKTGSNNGTSTVAISMLKSGESQDIATSEEVIQDGNWDPNVVHNFYVGALEKDENYTITLTITNDGGGGGYSGNFGLFYFHTVSQIAMPLAGTIAEESTHFNLSDGTFKNCKYNSDKVVSDTDGGGYMDDVLVYNTAGGYYKLLLNIKDYKAAGTLKATIYPFGYDTKETDAIISITSSGDKEIIWPDAISPGLKRLRFDFTGTKTSGTIFNYQKVTTAITKYSLNEAWNYSPIGAASVNVDITRSIAANKWSTIVLPFDIASSDITNVFGADASVAELTNESDENKLIFTTTLTDSKMRANQPYAIKVASDFSSKTINGVTIESATPTQSLTSWDFVGTYTSRNIPQDSYFFNSNKLWKAADKTNTIKPFRAYFTPKGVGARELKFIIDGDDTTSIGTIKADGTMETTAEGTVYNLSGQRVNKPAKGLYVINGKKVIIK